MNRTARKPIEIARIDMGERLRALDPAHVEFLAASIQEQGLRNPIEVEEAKDGFRLIAGAHRLAALKSLGEHWVEATIYAGFLPGEARLAEIDENLVRRDLDPLDRAVFLAERKAIYEKLHPETRAGHAGATGKKAATATIAVAGFPSFSKDTAEKVGLADRTIRHAIAIATGLTPASRAALGGTRIARKQSELAALARLTPAEQKKAIAGLLGEEPEFASVKAAVDAIKGRKTKRTNGFERLCLAWRKASAAERRQFRAFIDKGEKE